MKVSGTEYKHSFIRNFSDQLGNYHIPSSLNNSLAETPTESHLRVAKLLGFHEMSASQTMRSKAIKARDALYHGIEQGGKVTQARRAFLKFLDEEFDNLPMCGNKDLVDMKNFLGPEGLELYKKAIEEEGQSTAFRDAVFLGSTKKYSGNKLGRKHVIWVAGPSASGKSFAADAVVENIIEHAPTKKLKKTKDDEVVWHSNKSFDPFLSENHVVSVDGGVEREMSQMRQLVLQTGLKKGFGGLSDLHKHSKLSIKKHVEQAALQADQLHVVIPETFTSNPQKKLKKIAEHEKNPGIQQVFCEIAAPEGKEKQFQSVVERMGEGRAWYRDDPPQEILVNNRDIGCESKVYEAHHFSHGALTSKMAAQFFKNVNLKNKLPGQKPMFLTLTNDLIAIRYTPDPTEPHKGQWTECTSLPAQKGDILITERDFQRMKASKEISQVNNLDDVKSWLKENGRSGALLNTSNLEHNATIQQKSIKENLVDSVKNSSISRGVLKKAESLLSSKMWNKRAKKMIKQAKTVSLKTHRFSRKQAGPPHNEELKTHSPRPFSQAELMAQKKQLKSPATQPVLMIYKKRREKDPSQKTNAIKHSSSTPPDKLSTRTRKR